MKTQKQARVVMGITGVALIALLLYAFFASAAGGQDVPTIKVPPFDASKLTTSPQVVTGTWVTMSPKITTASTLTFCTGYSGGWLIIYPGADMPDEEKYKPANVKVVTTKEPVVTKKGSSWEITFKP